MDRNLAKLVNYILAGKNARNKNSGSFYDAVSDEGKSL
jgi:hypothetical protein